jgi:thioredoxin reductase (NADPH)
MPATAEIPAREAAAESLAFPRLDFHELEVIENMGRAQRYADGEVVFKAGDAEIDLYVVKSGAIQILNPTAGDREIVTHGPGEFAGDIDLLTRRPVIVTAKARGDDVVLLRVPNAKLRGVLNAIPRLGEKLITAFSARRELLAAGGVLGLKVVGPKSCRDTTVVREFLYKNFVPFTWYDTENPDGQREWKAIGSPKKTPAIECADKTMLYNPKLLDLAKCAGIWRHCPSEQVDLAVIGAGPAGIAAAVYAASEGLNTVVLDRLGPGGQVGGSSLVENFIGFPAGLSGADLATRGVLQMLKFGARMVAPVDVEKLEPIDDALRLQLSCGTTLDAQVVLVATGVRWRKLDVPGSEPFERQGIYYACTSVEAFLHQGQDVAVVGAGNSAGQAAMFLAERCARTVHLLVRRPEFGPGMSGYLADRIRAQPNITVHTGVEISAVHGSRRIESADLRHKDGSTSNLPLSAIFVFIGAEPHATWLPDSVARDELGYLLTGADAKKSGRWPLHDREPTPLETSLPRVLAGGDVRAGSTKRVGFAVGDGSLAVTCAHRIRGAH